LSKVVVIGGTGHFGLRICRRLLSESDVHLLVASRDLLAAAQIAAELHRAAPHAAVTGVALDHHSDSFEQDLAVLSPDLVIHTAGPFQGQDYAVARACMACGSHYIDLADGRSFVEAFSRSLDAAAQDAGVLLVAGASTLPALSSAVVEDLTHKWRSVESIEISIAPAQQTPRGLSTVCAVLSYCGTPFDVLIGGRWRSKFGWQSLKLLHYPQLGLRLSAVCDVPDLDLLPQRLPSLQTMTFRAALESKVEHVALWLLAALVRLRVAKDWSRHARSFQWLSRISQRLGSDVGGMRVETCGVTADDVRQRRQWNLVARRNQGPEIPVSPALVLARKLMRGQLSLRGAHPCVGLMSFQDFADEVAHLDIAWRTETMSLES